MFEQSILDMRNKRPWTVGVALIGEIALIGVLALIPLIYVQTLPAPELPAALIMPRPPAPPPSPPPAAPRHQTVVKNSAPVPRKFVFTPPTTKVQAPTQVPQTQIAEAPALPDIASNGGVPGGVPGGQLGGMTGGIAGAVPGPPPPPPPPPKAKAPEPAAPARIRVGGNVEAAKLEHEVTPAYPKLAKEARVNGTVRMKAVIAKDGTVEDLQVISGHPLLVPAAMEAVKKWIYKPTYLNGVPAEVETEIDVHFTLAS